MKALILLLALFCFNNILAQFSEDKNIAYCTDCLYEDVFSADLDGDGDMDILSSIFPENQIIWFENDGSGHFSDHQIITDEIDEVKKVVGVDLDLDGDIDVLSASLKDNMIAWYENDGAGNFSEQKIVTDQAPFADNVLAADFDGDGDLDILGSYFNEGNWYFWYENMGDENFSIEHLINDEFFSGDYSDMDVIDLDKDGDMDVLITGFRKDGFTLVWHENDGIGTFSSSIDLYIDPFAQHGTSKVFPTDLDSDNFVDLLIGQTYHIDLPNEFDIDYLAWVEYIHEDDFIASPQIIVPHTEVFSLSDLIAADLDLDGDLDVIYTSETGPASGEITWQENDGIGNFSNKMIISTEADWPSTVVASDLDGDGDKDLILESGRAIFGDPLGPHKIFWIENQLNDSPISSTHDINNIKINIYPNPNSSIINIDLDESFEYTFSLSNLNGKLILEGKNMKQIGVGHLTSGIYNLQVIEKDSRWQISKRIIVSN